MSFFRDQLEQWLKTLSIKADTVLDVGGSDNPVKGRVRDWGVKEYKILDLENPHEAKDKPDIICDIQEEVAEDMTMKEFDIIFCLEVAEYWYDPLQALKNMCGFLKPNGILYISFPLSYPMHNPRGKDFLRYTEWGVKKLLNKADFKINKIIPRVARSPALLRAFYTSDGMHHLHDSTVEHTGYLVEAIKR